MVSGHVKTRPGHCPSCEAAGEAGRPCPEKVCSIKGYHFIPDSYFNVFRDTPVKARDPHIGMLVDDFLVAALLGQGGFGRVFVALQLPLFMKAALKMMLQRASSDRLHGDLARKFESEALSLAHISHPNIVRLLKYGFFAEQPYMVMEFVDGGRTLKDEIGHRILSNETFDVATTRQIVSQVLNALQCAHEQRIVHRDIKPENIMLQNVAGEPNFVKVLDFGLAKFLEDGTQTSMLFGTPFYMAPEQVLRTNIGPWTDLYAVTVMLFEMLLGRRPFVGKTTEELVAQKLDRNFDPASRIADPSVPEFVGTFFRRAMAWEPEARYRSVDDFRQGMNLVFGELQQTQTISISAPDIGDLMESDALAEIQSERERLSAEREAIEVERERLAVERESVENLKRQFNSSDLPTRHNMPAVSNPGLVPLSNERARAQIAPTHIGPLLVSEIHDGGRRQPSGFSMQAGELAQPNEPAESEMAEPSASDNHSTSQPVPYVEPRRFPWGVVLVVLLAAVTTLGLIAFDRYRRSNREFDPKPISRRVPPPSNPGQRDARDHTDTDRRPPSVGQTKPQPPLKDRPLPNRDAARGKIPSTRGSANETPPRRRSRRSDDPVMTTSRIPNATPGLLITSTPPGAWVYRGKTRLGKTPLSLPQTARIGGPLLLVHRGYRSRSLQVPLDHGARIHVVLPRIVKQLPLSKNGKSKKPNDGLFPTNN